MKKALVSIVFVVLSENFISLGIPLDDIPQTKNYFDFPCGGYNFEITVVRIINNITKYCKGHLIHDRAALIPAQCLEEYGEDQGRLQIGIKVYEMTEFRIISNTFVHPNYSFCYGINNFAIVTFDTRFAVDYDIICLPDQQEITPESVKTCDVSYKIYFQNIYRKKEKCRDMILHHDYYKAENRNQLVRKIRKTKRFRVRETAYSQLITCDFDYEGFYRSFIFASTFYATIDRGNEDEYYMLYRQDYVEEIIPWITDVITSLFINK